MYPQGRGLERWRRCSQRSVRREILDRMSDFHMADRYRVSKAFEIKSPRSPRNILEMLHRTCPGPGAVDTFPPSRGSG